MSTRSSSSGPRQPSKSFTGRIIHNRSNDEGNEQSIGIFVHILRPTAGKCTSTMPSASAAGSVGRETSTRFINSTLAQTVARAQKFCVNYASRLHLPVSHSITLLISHWKKSANLLSNGMLTIFILSSRKLSQFQGKREAVVAFPAIRT
jgi:hypothetical protein